MSRIVRDLFLSPSILANILYDLSPQLLTKAPTGRVLQDLTNELD